MYSFNDYCNRTRISTISCGVTSKETVKPKKITSLNKYKSEIKNEQKLIFHLISAKFSEELYFLIEQLLDKNPDIINEITEESLLTPLMASILLHCDIKVISLIIEKMSNINQINKEGYTALLLISKFCNNLNAETIINLLISKGADIHIQNNKKYNALMLVSKYGCSHPSDKLMDILLEKGVSLTIMNKNKANALILAAENKSDKSTIIKLHKLITAIKSLKIELSSEEKDNYILTVLYTKYTSKGDINILGIIEQLGEMEIGLNFLDADFNSILMKLLLNRQLFEKKTLSLVEPVINFLLKSKINLNQINKKGHNALTYAAIYSPLNIFQKILDSNLNWDLKIEDKYGNNLIMTILDIESQFWDSHFCQIIELLINKGVDVNKINKYGHTALILAIKNNRPNDVVKLIFDKCNNVEFNDEKGINALSYFVARENLHMDICNLLLTSSNVDNLLPLQKQTPLKNAILKNNSILIFKCISLNCRLTKKDMLDNIKLIANLSSNSQKILWEYYEKSILYTRNGEKFFKNLKKHLPLIINKMKFTPGNLGQTATEYNSKLRNSSNDKVYVEITDKIPFLLDYLNIKNINELGKLDEFVNYIP